MFICDFLSDRYFKVCVGNIYSDLYSQEAGVPQGSILFVTLFSLKINSIVSCLLPDIKARHWSSKFFLQKCIIYRYYYIKRLVVTSLEDITPNVTR